MPKISFSSELLKIQTQPYQKTDEEEKSGQPAPPKLLLSNNVVGEIVNTREKNIAKNDRKNDASWLIPITVGLEENKINGVVIGNTYRDNRTGYRQPLYSERDVKYLREGGFSRGCAKS